MTPDIALLDYIGFFGLLCAALIMREGRLGWAMFAKNIAYGLGFTYAAVIAVFPALQREDVLVVLRVAIAATLTWASVELVIARYLLWRQGGRDPRLLLGRRERVVGEREHVATERD